MTSTYFNYWKTICLLALPFTMLMCHSVKAGDVIAMVSGDDLIILGTTQRDVIDIREDADGSVEIVGYEGTTINGDAVYDTNIDAFNDIACYMSGGHDEVFIYFDFDYPGIEGLGGNFEFQGGPGNDNLVAQLFEVLGDVDVEMNGGEDMCDFTNTVVVGNFDYAGGSNGDQGYFGYEFGTEFQPLIVLGDMTCRGGGGDDLTVYDATSVQGTLTQGCGSGSDSFYLDQSIVGILNYSGGGSGDFAFLGSFEPCEVVGHATIRSGGGADYVELGISNLCLIGGDATYFGGGGRDTINIGPFAELSGVVSATLGQGNDRLSASEDAIIGIPGTLNGGAGIDESIPGPAVLEAFGFTVLGFEN